MERALRFGTCLAAAAFVILMAGLVLFGASLSRYERRLPHPPSAEGVVVLTGGDQRMRVATALLIEGRARRLLISGVNRQTSRDDLRRLTGLSQRQFDCCVDIGYAARDTIGNAEETRAWASARQFTRVVVVTSSYHMPRSLAELGRAMPLVELVPHAVVSPSFHRAGWWLHRTTSRIVVTEYLKYLSSLSRLSSLRRLRPGEAGALAARDGSPLSLSGL